MRRTARTHWVLGAAIGLAACNGTIGEPQGGSGHVGVDTSALCTSKQPGPSPIRRMTRALRFVPRPIRTDLSRILSAPATNWKL